MSTVNFLYIKGKLKLKFYNPRKQVKWKNGGDQ